MNTQPADHSGPATLGLQSVLPLPIISVQLDAALDGRPPTFPMVSLAWAQLRRLNRCGIFLCQYPGQFTNYVEGGSRRESWRHAQAEVIHVVLVDAEF